jgi:hypothetical protein
MQILPNNDISVPPHLSLPHNEEVDAVARGLLTCYNVKVTCKSCLTMIFQCRLTSPSRTMKKLTLLHVGS